MKYLTISGLSRFLNNLKKLIPSKTSQLTNDSGFITSSSLPTVNDATLTIQKNGVNVETFTANASSNVTANITVPTKTSDLTNDSQFINNTSDCVHITGDESIDGQKTFNDIVYIKNDDGIPSLFFKDDRVTAGTAGTIPSANVYYSAVLFRDSKNSRLALINDYIDNTGVNTHIHSIYKFGDLSKRCYFDLKYKADDTTEFGVYAKQLIPVNSIKCSLGTSTNEWQSVYADSYYIGSTEFGDIVTHNSSEYSPVSHIHSISDISDFETITNAEIQQMFD